MASIWTKLAGGIAVAAIAGFGIFAWVTAPVRQAPSHW